MKLKWLGNNEKLPEETGLLLPVEGWGSQALTESPMSSTKASTSFFGTKDISIL